MKNPESAKTCRAGHLLHERNSRLVRHSKTGEMWLRCLICHAARQRKHRSKSIAEEPPSDAVEALTILIEALENYIDAVQAELAAKGLRADRDRIRERLLHPDNRHLLLPDAGP